MCDCVTEFDAKLAEYNTRLALPLLLAGGPQRLLIETEQIEKGRGKRKAVAVFSSFCPFCGEAHADGQS